MKNVYKNLEFDIVLNKLAEYAVSDVVIDALHNIEPTSDISIASKLLTQTGDALNVLASHRLDLHFFDVSLLLSKAKVGAILTPAELLYIKQNLKTLRAVKNCIDNVDGCDSLKYIVARIRLCDEIEYSIDAAIESESNVKDSASDKLYSIRRAIVKANARLKEKLDGYTHQSDISKYLQDNIVTLRGGRYVLPVRNDCKSHIKGLVHDVSATGATVFIEPFAIVEANNEIITLQTEEQNEVERILSELSKKVVSVAEDIASGQRVLTECGIIFARAEYAKHTNSYCPKLNVCGKIVLYGARHPLIDNKSVVPIDVILDKKRIMLISGPNTGGKTVALKTVGLFSVMAACGIFLPANDGSEIGVFDEIYCDIGDSQSIAQSLSTFSAHISNLIVITDNMNDKSLVLLDEVGDGTDPDEGAALAIAILKNIVAKCATAVVTTHFNSVKEFAIGYDEIESASMQFDNVNFKPTYKLLQGVSGSSYALEIAEKLGLDRRIVDDARAALSAEKISFDRIMREAESLRNKAFEEKQLYHKLCGDVDLTIKETNSLKIEYERKLAKINEEARAIIKCRADEYSDRAESLIEQIKTNLLHSDQAALFEARKIAKHIHDDVQIDEVKPKMSEFPPTLSELTVGIDVYISGLERYGTIASSPRGDKVLVAIGSVKTEIPISSLKLIRQEKKKPASNVIYKAREPENKEIMLIGQTIDEATQKLDIIIADIASGSILRIVHGKGSGALGKGIQAYLKRNSRVKSFRYGRYGEGDAGVTIAEIK